MITGIQITKANNEALLNSFGCWMMKKAELRCVCAKSGYAEDQIVPTSELGEIEYREVPLEVQPTVRVEGGQHLNVNVLSRDTLEDAVKKSRKVSSTDDPCFRLCSAFQLTDTRTATRCDYPDFH